MDREIPKEVRRRMLHKRLLKTIVGLGAAGLVIWLVISLLKTEIRRGDLILSPVMRGTLEVSVNATGKVAPAFEETVNSPINSRILEVYHKGGDSVEAGTPLLRLDLQAVETEYNKLLDEEQMKQLEIEQIKVKNQNMVSEMDMNLKISRLELSRKEVELFNERYLDSLGASTPDKVRQAQLGVNVCRLQLSEYEQKYNNQQALSEADLKIKVLELNIFRKSLAEMRRTLEDAQIRSPRKAILTYINNEIGARVEQGSRVAIVSDLSHFKVAGEIADSYGDRIAAGSRAVVKIGKEQLNGVVSDVTPLSRNGLISFTVQLDDSGNSRLRSGLKTDVYVMNAIKEDVLMISNGSYYSGQGEYELFVVQGDELRRRRVRLGESNYEHVEVVDGLMEGEEVVVSDMQRFSNKKLTINH